MSGSGFELVRVRGGDWGIRSLAYGEICHPGVGPRAEAEALYVRGLDLCRRLAASREAFVVWDIGLGGAANAMGVLDAAREVEGSLEILSLDRSVEGLEFALGHAVELGYFRDLLKPARALCREGRTEFQVGKARVAWTRVLGDIPSLLAGPESGVWPKPHALLFDPHSPAANPEMWTVTLFRDLWARLDPARPCALATYSRSTAVRAAMLVAGFYVGAGGPTETKEETTVAANRLDLLERMASPLGARWLERARRSRAAEPWDRPPFGGRPMQEGTWSALLEHPQFREVRPDRPFRESRREC